MIKISICLSDIPKEKISTSTKNNKKYIDIIVDERKETDTYGNTHTVYMSQTKEDRDKGVKRDYIGNGKEYVFNKTQSVPTQQAINQANQQNKTNTDDYDSLPF